MSGGKGGSQTTRVQLPQFVEDAAQRAVARGEQVGQIGYVPYYGPDVAAMTPMQQSAMAGTNQAAEAFGMPVAVGSGLPAAQDFGGVSGYSAAPMYDQALAYLQQTRPGQYGAITDMFIDPVTGAAPINPVARAVAPTPSLLDEQFPGGGSTGVGDLGADAGGLSAVGEY